MKKIYLKLNSPSVRKQIADAGIPMCKCCEFEEAVWLVWDNKKVHGVGYSDETRPISVEEACKLFKQGNSALSFDYKVSTFIEFIKTLGEYEEL